MAFLRGKLLGATFPATSWGNYGPLNYKLFINN